MMRRCLPCRSWRSTTRLGPFRTPRASRTYCLRTAFCFIATQPKPPCAIDVGRLASQADLISLSGHKVYGPQGIGALYVRRDLQDQIEPLIYGGGQQGGVRSGTVPTPLCVGMATGVDILNSPEGPAERSRVAEQRDSFVGVSATARSRRSHEWSARLPETPWECQSAIRPAGRTRPSRFTPNQARRFIGARPARLASRSRLTYSAPLA